MPLQIVLPGLPRDAATSGWAGTQQVLLEFGSAAMTKELDEFLALNESNAVLDVATPKARRLRRRLAVDVALRALRFARR